MRPTGPESDKDEQYGALYGAAAGELLLDAIAGSDGTRRSVVTHLFAGSTRESILGRFGFDRNGDPTIGAITVYQIRAKKLTTSDVLYPRSQVAEG